MVMDQKFFLRGPFAFCKIFIMQTGITRMIILIKWKGLYVFRKMFIDVKTIIVMQARQTLLIPFPMITGILAMET